MPIPDTTIRDDRERPTPRDPPARPSPDPVERHETPDPPRSDAVKARFHCVRQQTDRHDQPKLTMNRVLVVLVVLI